MVDGQLERGRRHGRGPDRSHSGVGAYGCAQIAIVLAVLALGACSDGTGGVAATVSGTGEEAGCTEIAEFDPARFVDPTTSTNPYHPLKPGTQWVRGGSTLVGEREVPHGIITTMTDVVRMIDGVPAVAMLDESTDSGEVAQVGMDYMALDEDGNVWILGGYTEEYEGGEYTNTESAWLGQGDGQRVGVLTPGAVTMQTAPWCIAQAPEEAASMGVPIELAASVCVAFGCFEDVHVIQEGEVGAPDNEHKFYAPGVGVIKNVPLDASLHKDRFELQNFLELTPDGLAEASRTVLDLEAHACATAPDVYGDSPGGERHL